MKNTIARGAALAGVVLAAASASAAEPYPIDVVMPLTGSAAFLGKGEQQSLQLAEKVVNATGGINGDPLELVFHDDESNPQTSVVLAGSVIAKEAAVIFGSSLVASCRAMAPLMKDGPVQYCFSPGIHPEPGYVFSSNISTLDLIAASIRYLRLKGWTRIALIFSTDATGQDAENGVKSVLAQPENNAMQIVASAHFNLTDVSVAAQLETLKGADPQALIAWSTGTPIATIFQGLRQAALDIPIVTTAGNMTYAQMRQYQSFLPQQLLMAAPQWVVTDRSQLAPGVAQAIRQYVDAFAAAGLKPDQSSSLAWDPAMIVVAGLRKLGTKAKAAQLRDFIAQLKDFPGTSGLYDFTKVPQRGLDLSDTVVTAWSVTANAWEAVSKPGGAPLR